MEGQDRLFGWINVLIPSLWLVFLSSLFCFLGIPLFQPWLPFQLREAYRDAFSPEPAVTILATVQAESAPVSGDWHSRRHAIVNTTLPSLLAWWFFRRQLSEAIERRNRKNIPIEECLSGR
ncbi:unnamed protein product [Linum trigynum]|uniref:Uncharacterized protein n=1 Tax=Linum trigynum TaxID=586398 RepID=A0AAV2ECJ8_9ROSI